jgi:uncharacterized membrane protein YphA (DoxX/SURF4 family)
MAGSAKIEALITSAGRIVLAAVFLYAGGLKALDPAGFALSIDNYRLLPYPAAAALALYLPWLELGGGLAVLWPRIRPGALAVLLGLGLVFSGVIASAWLRSLDIGCGCFGGDAHGRSALAVSLLRSVFLVLLCGWLLGREWEQHCADGADRSG